jgi:hypothetical protein
MDPHTAMGMSILSARASTDPVYLPYISTSGQVSQVFQGPQLMFPISSIRYDLLKRLSSVWAGKPKLELRRCSSRLYRPRIVYSHGCF